MSNTRWEHFEHKADIGIRGYGRSMASAFEQAAIAMTAVITEPSRIKPGTRVGISCRDSDNDTLFYDWLNALIFEMATRKMLFSEFEVRIENGKLDAVAMGEAIDTGFHQPSVEIKGATFTELTVFEHDGQWLAQCVIDV